MKITYQFSALTTFIYVFLSLPKLKCCPYRDYENALLPLKSPSFDSFVNFEERNSFEFGFWSLCVPQQQFKNINYVDQESDDKLFEDGQFIFLVKEQNGNSVIGFVSMSLQPDLVNHKILINGNQNVKLDFYYNPIIYEGKWILNVFTYNFFEGKISFEMTDQVKQSWNVKTKQFYTEIFLGGRRLIEKLILNHFKGRLSKTLIKKVEFQVESLFQYMDVNCQIPLPLQEEQTIFLVKGLQIFNGDISLQYTINQFGTRYCLSGWVKYDASRVIEKSTYPLIRISLFKNYFQQTYFGDEIFMLKAHINKIEPRLSQIEIITDFHLIPTIGRIGGSAIQSSQTLFNDWFTNNYFEGLQTFILFFQLYNNGIIYTMNKVQQVSLELYSIFNFLMSQIYKQEPKKQHQYAIPLFISIWDQMSLLQNYFKHPCMILNSNTIIWMINNFYLMSVIILVRLVMDLQKIIVLIVKIILVDIIQMNKKNANAIMVIQIFQMRKFVKHLNKNILQLIKKREHLLVMFNVNLDTFSILTERILLNVKNESIIQFL